MPNGPRNGVKTTRTSFRVIEELTRREGAGVTELAEALGLSKSTIHKHLTTLTDLGYLTRNDTTYHVGSRCLDLGSRAHQRVADVARPQIDRLALATGERAGVLLALGGMGVYAYSRDGRSENRAGNQRRCLVGLHCTAGGKAVLAYLPSERVVELLDRQGLPRRTSRTITDRDDLLRELQVVREQEAAFDRGERVRGQRGVAAPVRRKDGTSIAAVELSGPVDRLTGKRFEEDFTGLVLSVATAIEGTLDPS